MAALHSGDDGATSVPSLTASTVQMQTPQPSDIFVMRQGRDDKLEERLIEVLAAHKATFIDKKGSDDIVSFVDSFHDSYSLLRLQDDFDVYLAKDATDALFAESFLNRMLVKLDGKPCLVSQCPSAARNGRPIDAALMYGAGVTEAAMAYHQILDSVHVKCLHSFDRYRLRQKEKESAPEGQLTLLAQKKACAYDEQIEMS